MDKVKLKEIAEVCAGQAAPKLFTDSGLPFIRAGHLEDLINGKNISELPKVDNLVSEKNKLKKIPKGTILFAKSGMSAKMNRIYICPQDVYFVSHLAAILPSDKYNTSFLSRFLNWYNPSKLILDEAYPSIRLEEINNLEIPLPNLATQQKIATILDQADAIIQNNRAIVQKYDALTQSLFLDMFGDYRKNSNNFPKYLFDEIATKITDGDHLTPKREEKGYKLLSCRNIKNGYIDFSAGLDFVGESEFNRMFKRCNPEKGDILISCSGTIGRTTSIKIDEPFVLVRSAALVKPKRDLVDSLYLEYYLRTDYMQSVMKKSSNTSSQANLFTGPIKKLPIFLPPFKLQNQFAERVAVIEAQKQQAQLELAKSEELFASLLQSAFKGELV